MFDIRKIQEQVIYGAVKSASDDETAHAIVYGKDDSAKKEDGPTWVKATMKELSFCFFAAVSPYDSSGESVIISL